MDDNIVEILSFYKEHQSSLFQLSTALISGGIILIYRNRQNKKQKAFILAAFGVIAALLSILMTISIKVKIISILVESTIQKALSNCYVNTYACFQIIFLILSAVFLCFSALLTPGDDNEA